MKWSTLGPNYREKRPKTPPQWVSGAGPNNKGVLGFEDVPPGQHPLHQRPHAQFAGDGQGLVQQGHGLLSVAGLVPLEQSIGVVAAALSF